MWIDKRNLPRDLIVSLRELATGSQIKVTVRDSLGLGPVLALEKNISR
jgi:hypothetical protein